MTASQPSRDTGSEPRTRSEERSRDGRRIGDRAFNGDKGSHGPDPIALFWSRVDQSGGPQACWPWTANRDGHGYGWVSVQGKIRGAHVRAYELSVGAIPPGLEIDHLCRNRICVNPSHLETVTSTQNTLRGNSPAARHARQVACTRGHPFDAENTRVTSDGRRQCRACDRARQAKRRAT